MDSFLHNKNDKPTSPHATNSNKHHPKPSNSELLSSAKLVADAAKSSFAHDPNNKVDMGKVAGAAENLLNAASSYGKLDEKGYGKYIDQAENYLHKYHTTHTTTTTVSGHTGAGEGQGAGSPTSVTQTTTTTTTHSSNQPHDGKEHNYGEYMKMAEGFLKKH